MRNELPLEATADRTDRPGPRPLSTHRRWRRRAGAFGVLGVAALIAAGCGSTSKTSTAAATPAAASAPTTAAAAPTPTTGATAATAATGATGAASTKGTTITATLTEFKIALSRTDLSPGTYTFHAVNAGHTVHALEIDGPGVEDQATPGDLQPGQTANLTVTLKPGTYDVFCPVGDHKTLGMNLELTVGGSAADASTAKPVATTVAGSGSGY
jgi:uncharacterized cupredoxin-like copper-binding protein